MEDQPLRSENVSSINAERKLARPLVACYCDSFPSARRYGAAVWSVTPVIIDVALDQSVSTVLLIRAKNYERCPDVGVARRLAASSGRKLAFLMFALKCCPDGDRWRCRTGMFRDADNGRDMEQSMRMKREQRVRGMSSVAVV